MEKMTLTRKEAAEQCNVSLPTLDAYMRRKKNPLPHFKAGRKVIIPCERLNQWLSEESDRNAGINHGDSV